MGGLPQTRGFFEREGLEVLPQVGNTCGNLHAPRSSPGMWKKTWGLYADETWTFSPGGGGWGICCLLTSRERNTERMVGFSEVVSWSPFSGVDLRAQLARGVQIRIAMICDNHTCYCCFLPILERDFSRITTRIKDLSHSMGSYFCGKITVAH